jgi:hypothetical protein
MPPEKTAVLGSNPVSPTSVKITTYEIGHLVHNFKFELAVLGVAACIKL